MAVDLLSHGCVDGTATDLSVTVEISDVKRLLMDCNVVGRSASFERSLVMIDPGRIGDAEYRDFEAFNNVTRCGGKITGT